GATSRKMIEGMMVMYASPLATVSERPVCAVVTGAGAAAAPPPTDCPTALPHCVHEIAESATCAPHEAQKRAMRKTLLGRCDGRRQRPPALAGTHNPRAPYHRSRANAIKEMA